MPIVSGDQGSLSPMLRQHGPWDSVRGRPESSVRGQDTDPSVVFVVMSSAPTNCGFKCTAEPDKCTDGIHDMQLMPSIRAPGEFGRSQIGKLDPSALVSGRRGR